MFDLQLVSFFWGMLGQLETRSTIDIINYVYVCVCIYIYIYIYTLRKKVGTCICECVYM